MRWRKGLTPENVGLGSNKCAQAIVALNYRGGGPQVSEHLLIQGQVKIERLYG